MIKFKVETQKLLRQYINFVFSLKVYANLEHQSKETHLNLAISNKYQLI